jgi:hypothetical protein
VGIGNKGLGFRGIEALTDNERADLVAGDGRKSDRFDGYCFRFASAKEIEDSLRSGGVEPDISQEIAQSSPVIYSLPA